MFISSYFNNYSIYFIRWDSNVQSLGFESTKHLRKENFKYDHEPVTIVFEPYNCMFTFSYVLRCICTTVNTISLRSLRKGNTMILAIYKQM